VGELYALVSGGGSPGVTTTAVALALAWPSPVIVAECDPSGGDVLAGLLTGHVPASLGLMEHAIDAGHKGAAAAIALEDQLMPLDADQTRMLLPGLTDPRQAIGLASAWPAVVTTLTAQEADVIADCGRLDAGPSQPLAVLAAARTVALVLRPTLRQVWSARSRVEILSHIVSANSRLALVVCGRGPHTAHEIAHALGVPVAAVLPDDARSAALLSDGMGGQRSLSSSPLLRAAQAAGNALRDHQAIATDHPGAAEDDR
jgi:hypothetical protein